MTKAIRRAWLCPVEKESLRSGKREMQSCSLPSGAVGGVRGGVMVMMMVMVVFLVYSDLNVDLAAVTTGNHR